MTLGDLLVYAVFVGLLAAPLIQIASIGTQISEAFAGLDRIREIRRMVTEDASDRTCTARCHRRRRRALRSRLLRVQGGHARATRHELSRDGRINDRARRLQRLGQEHADQPYHGVQSSEKGRILVDGRDLDAHALREYRAHLGVVLQDNFLFDGTIGENIAFSKPGATMAEIRMASRIAHCDEFVSAFEPVRHHRRRARRAASPVDSASASPSRAQFSPIRASSSSTRRPRASTARARR